MGFPKTPLPRVPSVWLIFAGWGLLCLFASTGNATFAVILFVLIPMVWSAGHSDGQLDLTRKQLQDSIIEFRSRQRSVIKEPPLEPPFSAD